MTHWRTPKEIPHHDPFLGTIIIGLVALIVLLTYAMLRVS